LVFDDLRITARLKRWSELVASDFKIVSRCVIELSDFVVYRPYSGIPDVLIKNRNSWTGFVSRICPDGK